MGWMKDIVGNAENYSKLFDALDSVPFRYSIAMDANREEDGIDLRYRFGFEYGYTFPEIAHGIDCRPCSVLEMLVALAIRCEEHIMSDEDIGDRTGLWFWTMMENLALDRMDDYNFDLGAFMYVIDIFLDRKYPKNGVGNIFCTEDKLFDMPNTEIWYQLHKYLKENYY